MGYTPTTATTHDDISAEEDELLNGRYGLENTFSSSYEGSDIGKDHLYHE